MPSGMPTSMLTAVAATTSASVSVSCATEDVRLVVSGSRTAWTRLAPAADGRDVVDDALAEDVAAAHPAVDTTIVTTSAVQGEWMRMPGVCERAPILSTVVVNLLAEP